MSENDNKIESLTESYFIVEFGNNKFKGQYIVRASNLQDAESKADKLIFDRIIKILMPLNEDLSMFQIKHISSIYDSQLVSWSAQQ